MWRAMLRRLTWILCALCYVTGSAQTGSAMNLATNLSRLRGTGAAAMLLDAHSGRALATLGDVDTEHAPGSAVKPFVLRAALEARVIAAGTKVHCTGALRIAGRNLACVHPRDVTVLDARQALAESCNTYFAAVGQRMDRQQLVSAMRASGLQTTRVPQDADERELMALGLADVIVSVRTLADAYRGLALWMTGSDPAGPVVRDGMLASVRTGVAHAAYVEGMTVAGKTGTVDVRGTGRSYGWFAGVVYDNGTQPATVMVVFVPRGNGHDAAALARRVLVSAR